MDFYGNMKIHPKRTNQQSKAIHKYLTMVADELINQGQTMQNVVKKIRRAEITPTTVSIKEIVWKPLQKALLGKDSTTELTTAEVTKVYKVMSMWLAKEFNISLPFPSEEETENYLKSYEQYRNK